MTYVSKLLFVAGCGLASWGAVTLGLTAVAAFGSPPPAPARDVTDARVHRLEAEVLALRAEIDACRRQMVRPPKGDPAVAIPPQALPTKE